MTNDAIQTTHVGSLPRSARVRELLTSTDPADEDEFDAAVTDAVRAVVRRQAEVGIDVDLSVVEWATWVQRIFLGGDYDMTIIGHSEPRDINVYGNPDYYYHYDNPAVAALLDQAEAAQTPEAQQAAYQEIATIIARDAVNVWVFSPPYLVAAQQDVYGFWTDQPTPAIDMTEVYRAQ
jgi:peptide/nickel transport system substrate-binding protein